MYPEPPIPPTVPPEPELHNHGRRNIPPWHLKRTPRPTWTHTPAPQKHNAGTSSGSGHTDRIPKHEKYVDTGNNQKTPPT
eukprot:7508022-Prorocentrum_lima.AAC.1